MHFLLSSVFSVGLFASIAAGQSGCWPEWSDLASDFKSIFVEDGTCTDMARASIRLAFHDCFRKGSCDGSIITAEECADREENAQMIDICSLLAEKSDEYGVGTADIIQFAAAIGLASCSGGPVISFYSGREDSYSVSPLGTMPDASTDASAMVDMFARRGFSKFELVALAGAHTIGRRIDGTSMGSTVGVWNHTFYSEVSSDSAPHPLAADTFMSQAEETAEEWRAVGKSQKSFTSAFIPAMEKLSMMGSDKKDLVDCSSVVQAFASSVRSRRRKVI